MNKDLLKLIINHYGFFHQRDILIEECSELIQAICKCKRKNVYDDFNYSWENFKEEVADVKIMVEQMCLFIGEDEMNGIIEKKLNRQFERMKNEED